MHSPRLLTFVRKRFLFLAYASLAAVILGELGRFYWLLELFSHFVPLHAVFLWLGVCASSTTRSRLLFGLVAALLTGWMLTPRTDAPTQTQQIRFYQKPQQQEGLPGLSFHRYHPIRK